MDFVNENLINYQVKKEKMEFYSSQAEDYKPRKQILRKLRELFHLLEVEAAVIYIFETKDRTSK